MDDYSEEYALKARAILAYVLTHNDMDYPLIHALHPIAVDRLAREIAQAPALYASKNIGPVEPELRGMSSAPQQKKLVLSEIKLPAIPKIVSSLNQALSHEETSADDIASIIELDTSLSAALLKLVNSPFYGLTIKVEAISRAVTVLGHRQVYTLAIGQMVSKFVSAGVPKNIDLYVFWEHCIGCAIISRCLSELRGDPDPETLFIAGMLHDVGRLVQFSSLPAHTQFIFRELARRQVPIVQAEMEILGLDHAMLGGLLLDDWGVPASLADVVRHHHDPLAASDVSRAAVVHVADLLTHMLIIEPKALAQAQPTSSQAWESLGLGPEQVVDLAGKLDAHIQDTLAILLH
jgi:HD-like signal output (HDOD) protein